MRLVDLRPSMERRFAGAWSPSPAECQQPPFLSRLWTEVADRVMARRVGARQAPPQVPFVVSVGNLALGGTGKTPVIIALATDLSQSGLSGCVLTRGFRSTLAGPLVVHHNNQLAGDEARLMAARLAPLAWPVVQARNRALGLDFLRDHFPAIDIILIEDGHQTRDLGRHLDILILDRWVAAEVPGGRVMQPGGGQVFPWGPYRESAKGAKRAGILLVETEGVIPDRGEGGQATAAFNRHLRLQPVSPDSPAQLSPAEYAVLSGIARPEAFEQGLKRHLGSPAQLAIRLRDHQEYSASILARIFRELSADGGLPLVTTAKDWVKLAAFWPADRPAFVAELDINWGQPNALPQLVRKRAGFF